MMWGVIGDFIDGEMKFKMIPIPMRSSNLYCTTLLLITSIPWCPMSLIRKQIQTESNVNMCLQNDLDEFQLVLGVPESANLVTQHIFHT